MPTAKSVKKFNAIGPRRTKRRWLLSFPSGFGMIMLF
jgi:hypothetical protein